MANAKKYVGDAAIRKAIKSLNGVIVNVNDRVQDIAVSIIEHAAGPGNGDMSRALDLCKTVARHRTLNVAYLVGYFRYFASTNVNLRGNDGDGKVSLMSKDAKGYRGFDVDGARANNWYDAFDADGNRSTWYAGPAPADFQPMTVGDLAQDFIRFADRELKKLDATKEVNGKTVPIVSLNEQDRQNFENALEVVRRLANTIARHEEAERHIQRAKELEAQKDEPIVTLLEQPREKAVA